MTTRPDGIAYIDTATAPPEEPLEPSTPPASSSGSSVEEDSDNGEVVWDDPDQNSDEEGSVGSRSNDEWNEDSIEEDDNVDDADWELSTRDFTKQYNRLRQHHAAVNGQAIAGPSRPPIPAQNIRAAQSGQTKQDVSTSGTGAGKAKVSTKHLKDKSDRATQDQVMDSRTKLVLSGLTNRGVIGRLERCISSGKEANVYFASPTDPTGLPTAVKVYRTSILKFRSRQNYIVGEHRFAGEYSSSRNARKMVRVWAEKELRNLKRLEQGGIRAPRVKEGTQNILVMEFLGIDGVAAPRLKDAEIADNRWHNLYAEMLVIMRRMYIVCRLVHADLSEYNILIHQDHLYIIDVSQSVEYDHPKSMEFLRTDVKNITSFFQRRAGPTLRTMGLKRAWEFIVTPGEYDESTVEEWLNEPEIESKTDQQDENVFMTSFIPRNLGEIHDPEAEVHARGMPEAVDRLVLTEIGQREENAEESDEFGSGDTDDSESGDIDGAQVDPTGKPRGFRHEDKHVKKARKQAIKEENRLKRESKMPKGEKKKLIKKTKGR